MASDFDLAKAQYESKNMLDAELLDGLIKERIVLQYGEKIEDIITEEDVEKKLQALKAEQNGNIFYQKAMKEYGSEEAIKIALKNRLIYNFVKDDLMNQFLSVLRIDEDKLYFRAEEFAEQYDIDRLDVKAKLFCPEIAGLFCRIAGLFCHDSRANLSLKPVCFGIAIS